MGYDSIPKLTKGQRKGEVEVRSLIYTAVSQQHLEWFFPDARFLDKKGG